MRKTTPDSDAKALDGRLSAVADYVRAGTVLADIGTDHAYLPIALCQTGKIRRAVAADIAAGPLAKAREHIEARGLSEKIAVFQTDGLTDVERYTPTDIAICGMGGELIVKILSRAAFVRDPAIRLILQPMTMQAVLRRWLWENGFSIDEETVAATGAGEKLYPVLCCHFTGEATDFTPLDALVGKKREYGTERKDKAQYTAYLSVCMERQRVIVNGKRKASADCTDDEELLFALEQMLNDTH